jgi:nitronate monooxygenase
VILDSCTEPVVLAPLAGGPSTPELAAAVSDAGGLGFLAAGYLTPVQLADRLVATRRLSPRPFGVNLFVPGPPAPPGSTDGYARAVEADAESVGSAPGEPRWDDDGYDAKLDVLLDAPPAVVSFTFGLPTADTVRRVHGAGAEAWITVTSVAEAQDAVGAGADALVVQGAEAGGHRGGRDDDPRAAVGLLPLLQLVGAQVEHPLIATGGIATGAGIAAVLVAGARAAALGTAFLDCPEAGTTAVHREALRGSRPTALTRAFTGRTARGIVNGFLERHDAEAPAAYPEVHHLTAPLRSAARAAGRDDLVNLWAGQAYALTRSVPAGQLVRDLGAQAGAALARAALTRTLPVADQQVAR